MTTTIHPPIVSRDEWLGERLKLLAHEKELTKEYDRVNAERRQLPMVKIEKELFVRRARRKADSQGSFRRTPATDCLSLHVRSGLGQRMPGLHRFCECVGGSVVTASEGYYIRCD